MTRRSLLILLFIGILLASCGPGQPTADVNATIAANAETMVAALFLTQTAMAPSATNTSLPTITPLATSTALTLSTPTTFVQQPVVVVPSVTPTGPTPTPLSSSLAAGCKNLRLINSWTEPDDPFNPGQDFTQFWQVENNGTCDWLYLFEVTFASGDKFGETTAVRFGKKIEPGKWTTLSVGMHAPNKSGNYKASWRMSDGAGSVFGSVLPIAISVGGPTNTPKADTGATAAAQTVAAQQTIDAAVATAVAATASKEAACAVNPPPDLIPPCPPTPALP